MLLDEKEAIAVQLVKVSAEELTAKTEDNQLITIKADKKTARRQIILAHSKRHCEGKKFGCR
ncbi:hypothetical protein [Secundilactobacillus kimchicus]|uniref:hypothetical protein n=1 Tax=Secundilactobacillus kimchicus TaxID=528209 RepID=UPI0006D23765|nr:hypothetical protein [Secundilactobacillus kimchicus]